MSNIRKLERIVASLAFFLGGVLILGDKEALGLFFTLSGIFALYQMKHRFPRNYTILYNAK